MTSRRTLSVTIIGAGVAGLTAACALARQGHEVRVLERADALREVGAGLQISANAIRVIEALGLWPQFEAISLPSKRVELRDSVGEIVAVVDLARFRSQDKFRLVHRARLVEMLETAARAAGVQIELGQDIRRPPREGDLVIGADGVKSRIRSLLNGNETPFFTGQTAWRALIADPSPPQPVTQVFMGPRRHLVSYPLAGGLRNIVAVMERSDWHDEGWSQPGEPAELREAFADFGGPVPYWLSQVQEVSLWGLFRHPVAEHWYRPPLDTPAVALIGDAAHPTLPFMAQGAVMAIEDAWILVACLSGQEGMTAALERYQSLRRPRCQRIIETANGNARNYHLRGPARAIAHAGLRTLSRVAPGQLVERFDWLYDYDPTAIEP